MRRTQQDSVARRKAGERDGGRQTDQFVASFARGLSVIRAFGEDSGRLTLTEVAARANLTRAGARRILLTLQALGYVGCDERRFFLTPKILDLGYSYLSTTPLWHLAEPFMEEVVNQVHESCSASVLDGTEIVYILRVPTKKIMTISLSIGSRLPAWCTSMGRVLLGDLPPETLRDVLDRSQIKAYTSRTVTDRKKLEQIIRDEHRKGWSLVNQELEDGLISISVPLLGRNGRVIAAMNVSGHASRTTPTEMTRNVLPVLKLAAEKINAALRLRPG
ncbi:MAG TPA: IclR family transcriptional regulator [Burkholderiales bacterium]|nr:IclR family transcriptional regulator [Burkholderiales bacterium]